MKETHFKNKKIIQGIVLIVAIILVSGLLWVVGKPMVKFVSEPEKFRAWVDEKGLIGRLAFALMTIFQVFAAIIPGEPFEIAAGYAFGAIEGTILCILSSAIGSMIVFFLVRKFGYKLVDLFFDSEKVKSLRFLNSNKKRDFLFLIIFALPGTPKDLLSYFAGLTNIKTGTWLLICSLGRIPSIATSTIGGDAIGDKNYLTAILVFAGTMLLSGIGLFVYDRLSKRYNQRHHNKKEIEKE